MPCFRADSEVVGALKEQAACKTGQDGRNARIVSDLAVMAGGRNQWHGSLERAWLTCLRSGLST